MKPLLGSISSQPRFAGGPLAGLFLLFGLQVLEAATNAASPALNDWRQLSGKARENWYAKSESELLKIAEDGNPAAQFVFWDKFRATPGPKDKALREKARAMLDAAAEAGLPQAVFQKGWDDFVNSRESPDKQLAGWATMERAAETGYPYGQWRIAQYETGVTSSQAEVKPNLKRALEYLRNGADAGYLEAKVELAMLYSSGVGEPRNAMDSPHALLITAARSGWIPAIEHLSVRYAFGHGEALDPLEAARLCCIARTGASYLDEDGNAKAQDLRALDDVARAFSLFYKADALKNAGAAASLARLYLEAGKPAEAAALFKYAKDLGHADADAELKKLEPTLTPEQKKEGAAKFSFLSSEQ